jgi:2-C-methyl-D-erythritol 4-phosphate cytidylyltransferase
MSITKDFLLLIGATTVDKNDPEDWDMIIDKEYFVYYPFENAVYFGAHNEYRITNQEDFKTFVEILKRNREDKK